MQSSLHLLGRLVAGIAIAGGVSMPTAAATVPRADGSELTYHLDQVERDGRQSILLMLQGSGCEPVADREWVTSMPLLLARGHAVLMIEKYGVVPGQPEDEFLDGCSKDYWRKNTLQRRVLDAVQVVARLRKEPWWNGELVIYGGSEGGAVAAMLAPLLPETKAVIIQSAGIGVPVGELIRSAVPPSIAAEMLRVFTEAKVNPSGDKRMGGASYRWWADAVDVTPATLLLQADMPVLLVHGTRDQFAPVATARATRDLFAGAGKGNLTYWEYVGYDHFMRDAAGADHQPEVLKAAAAWLLRKTTDRQKSDRSGL